MVQKARELGCDEIRLETNHVLWDATRLYERHGFTAVKPEHPSTRCDQAYCLRIHEIPVAADLGVQALPDTWDAFSKSSETGVPRQFGVGTGLLITTMFAVLFAVLQMLHVAAGDFAIIALFFLGVGAGQALLFHGRRPRRASIVMGVAMMLALGVFGMTIGITTGGGVVSVEELFTYFIFGVCCGGPIFGYLAGLLIASVFLVCETLENAYRRRFPPKDEGPCL
jgi:hypothetical protein